MSFKRLIVLIVGLLPMATIFAQGPGKAVLRVDDANDSTMAVRFEWGNFFVANAGHHYSELQAEGMTLGNGEVGMPALPTMSTVVTLPRGSRLWLNTLEYSDEIWDSMIDESKPLAPVTAAWIKDSLWPGYHPDMKTYATDAYYRGGAPMEVKHIGTMGSSEVYRITARPVAYNPVRHSLRVSTSLQAMLGKDISAAATIDSTLPKRYMIVTRRQFCNGLQAFVDWKRQEGFDVEVLTADTNRREVVKALIESHWETADGRWPEYILLVGDAAQLQSYLGTTRPQGMTNHITDLYYADHTGDHLPDAMIGRWPVNDTAELRAVMTKTLHYEQCDNLDNSILERALLVAGTESNAPAPVTTNGQVNYLKGRLAEEYPTVDTICHHNPSSANERPAILAEIAQGVGFINYTAHCSTGGWSNPPVGFITIDTLGCTQPTVFVNNCCQSNDFGATCFGERLLRKPLGGAIGVIGATNSTLWEEDYYWAVGPKYPFSLEPTYDSLHRGAFDLWLDGDATTMGALLIAGNMSVLAFGSPYEKFYWEIYCLMGDPSLRPYLGIPGHISLWTPDTLTVGATEIRVSGTKGATVTAVQGDRLLGTVVLDDHRSMDIPFRQSADTLPIIVTATMAQAMPVVDTVYMARPEGRAVAFSDIHIVDTTIDLTVSNIGTDTITGLIVQLQCADSAQAIFSSQPAIINTLIPSEEQTVHLTLNVLRWERTWSGVLGAHGQTDSIECGTLHLHGRLDGVPPTLRFTLLDADSVAATSIEPNSNYLLQTLAEGIYDSISITVTAHPTNTQLSTTHYPLSTINSHLYTPDTITHLRIEATITRGNYCRSYDLWMVSDCRQDSFEEGFDSHPWDRSSLNPWIIDSTVHNGGAYSIRSAPIAGRQTSDIGLDVTLGAADSIIFCAKASSEKNYDKLLFYIDNERHMELSGNTGWCRFAYPIGAGSHRLLWRYVKDDSDSQGSDCGWIDDVQLPLAQWDAPYGWFDCIDTLVAIDSPLPITHSPLTIVPNPTSGKVTIEGAISITLIDLNGRRLMTVDGPTIDLGALPAGTYIAVINIGTTIVYEKITRQ